MLNTDRLCPGCMTDNGGESPCPVCGYDSSKTNSEDMLPTRFILHDRYMIGRVISSNGENVTYIGWDNNTDTAVHIREYYPRGMSLRNPDRTVSIIPDRKFSFNEGLMEFLELGKKLMGGEFPAIVPVLSVFEENGTAYSISPVIQSITLEDFLVRNGGSLKWEQARPLFLPLIDTLGALHTSGIILGGISPETIIAGRDGKLRFSGISIRKLRDSASGFEPELFSGYSAAEQYSVPELEMTEATDVYALSAVFFRVLIGTVPPDSVSRLEKDGLSIPARFAEELPRQVLVSLANGMQTLPSKRTASVETFKNELVYGETAEQERINAQNRAPSASAVKSGKNEKKKKGSSSAKYAVISAVCTAAVFLILAGVVVWIFRDQLFDRDDTPLNTTSDFATPSGGPQIGDYDSDVVDSVKLYDVPDLVGKYYSQIVDNDEYEKFKFSIQGKAYSDKYPRGAICAQSIAKGTGVEKNTTIQLTISLGSKEFKIANVIGFTKDEAIIELLKQGFLYENIIVEDSYDSSESPGVVLEQTPEYNTKTNAETVVHIYINTYTGEDDSLSADEGSDYESE